MPMAMKPGGERRLEHVAGQPRVLADDDPMAMVAAREVPPGRQAQPQRHLRGHRRLIGGAANAIGAEQSTSHSVPSPAIALGRAYHNGVVELDICRP